jgi:hypothetical protein
MSIIPSSDPTGAESLLAIDLVGGSNTQASIYSPLVTLGPPSAVTPAPEPSPRWLIAALLLVLVASRSRVRRLLPGFRATICMVAGGLAVVGSAPAGILTGVGQDSNFTVSFSGLRLDRVSNTMVSIASVKNISSSTIQGPFYIGITNISNPTVTLANGGGNLTDGNPYVAIAGVNTILAGQTMTAILSFHVSGGTPFNIQAKIYDAVSAPPTATLNCPGGMAFFGNSLPFPAVYTPPMDSLGRMAACSPPSGSLINGTTINCFTSGGASLPASCSFIYAFVQAGPTITITPPPPPPPGPQFANLALIPCAAVAALYEPGAPPPPQIDKFLYCGFPDESTVGMASFTIVNYGPTAAQNVSVTLSFPPGIQKEAWKFSKGGSCSPLTDKVYIVRVLDAVNFPEIGHTVTCTFPSINPNETVDATIGVDVPASGSYANVPNIEAQVAVDPAFNTDPDLTNNQSRFSVNPGFNSITVPQSVVPQQGCDYSKSPGFAILLNTCGVPSFITQAIVGGVLGAATIVAGGGALVLEFVGGAVNFTVFDAGQAMASTVLLVR